MTFLEAESLYRRELESSVDSFQAFNLQSSSQNSEVDRANPPRLFYERSNSQCFVSCSDATSNSLQYTDSDDDSAFLGHMNRLVSQDLSTIMSEANVQNRPLRPQVNGYGIYKREGSEYRDSGTNYCASFDTLAEDFRLLVMGNPVVFSGNARPSRNSTPRNNMGRRINSNVRQYSEPIGMQNGFDEQRLYNHTMGQNRSSRIYRDSNKQRRNGRQMNGNPSKGNRMGSTYPPGLGHHIAKSLTIDPVNGNVYSANSIDTVENAMPPMETGLPEQYVAEFPLVFYNPRSRCTHCNICLEDYMDGEVLRKLPCRHIYHRDCVDTWFKRRSICPTCRLDYLLVRAA